MYEERNYSRYADYFSCIRNHIWTSQHKIASISSDHHKITIKRRYTLALELQVGHRMTVALWVRGCIVGVSWKTWRHGQTEYVICKTWSMGCSDTRVGEWKFTVRLLRRAWIGSSSVPAFYHAYQLLSLRENRSTRATVTQALHILVKTLLNDGLEK